MYWWYNLKKYCNTDLNANGMRGLCTEIAVGDIKKGDWLFEWSGTRATHVGFAISSTEAIECRGRDYGVCITKIKDRN